MIATTSALRVPFPLKDSDATLFQNNGHIYLEGVLSSEEVSHQRAAITDAVARHNTEKRRMEERDTYGKAFLQIMNLWEVDEAVKKFVLAKRFARIAADLLGVKNVRLYHDQALFKEPGGGPTPWHQDQYYWPVDTNNTVTMWMPLIDIDVEMGMLTFASGSHKEGLVKNLSISDASDAELNDYVIKKEFPIVRAQKMKAGDATFHYGQTLHHAPGNYSQVMREVMTIIYIADGCHIAPPANEHQEADRQRWFLGLPVGSPAASKINPLID